MHRVLAQTGAELAELQLFAARLPAERVVVIARLLAHEEHGFHFLLPLAGLRHDVTYYPNAKNS
jgi:hypothetical protein